MSRSVPARPIGLALLAALTAACLAVALLPNPAYGAAALDSTEAELCRLINDFRAENGLQPLKVSTDLSEASDWHTDDMASMDYFSHTDSLGRDPFTRMDFFGYDYPTTRGENIAAGSSGASATLTQWKNSAPHRANLLTTGYKVMGLARNNDTTSTYNYYWNNTFGGFVDSTAVPCPGSSPQPSPSPSASPTASPSAVSIGDASALEGNSVNNKVKFTVSLSEEAASTITVRYETANGTATGGSDYRTKSGTLTFAAGQTSQTLPIPTLFDRNVEPDETFAVNLSAPTGGATIGDGQGTGTIRNDD